MAKKKPRNYIDVPVARAFMKKVYGLGSVILNPYTLMIIHEEIRVRFYWYHTTGKVMAHYRDKNEMDKYVHLPKCYQSEDCAIAIQKWTYEKLKGTPSLYWVRHSPMDVSAMVRAKMGK